MTLKTAGKGFNVHNPMMFMAQDREIAQERFRDVIGYSETMAGCASGDSRSRKSGEVVFKTAFQTSRRKSEARAGEKTR